MAATHRRLFSADLVTVREPITRIDPPDRKRPCRADQIRSGDLTGEGSDEDIFVLRIDTQPLTSAFGVMSLHDRIEQPDSPVWSPGRSSLTMLADMPIRVGRGDR